mgnify:CR=1 FL=1
MSDNKFLLNGILAFSILSLSTAFFIQYVLGHKPCNLCLIERIPYFSAVVLVSLIFMVKRFEILFSAIILIFFILGALISFYHVGIEQGFFNESFVCNLGNSETNLSAEQLLKQLENTPISCKEVTFKFLGLSLATINTIISIILSGIMLKILKNYGQNK